MLPYPERALLCLAKSNPVRRTAVLVSHNKWFERFVLGCIFCNCITLALSSNRQGFQDTALGIVLNKFEYAWVRRPGQRAQGTSLQLTRRARCCSAQSRHSGKC
jgi:hypothetical protein